MGQTRCMGILLCCYVFCEWGGGGEGSVLGKGAELEWWVRALYWGSFVGRGEVFF